jgi:hypothetical protein
MHSIFHLCVRTCVSTREVMLYSEHRVHSALPVLALKLPAHRQRGNRGGLRAVALHRVPGACRMHDEVPGNTLNTMASVCVSHRTNSACLTAPTQVCALAPCSVL